MGLGDNAIVLDGQGDGEEVYQIGGFVDRPFELAKGAEVPLEVNPMAALVGAGAVGAEPNAA